MDGIDDDDLGEEVGDVSQDAKDLPQGQRKRDVGGALRYGVHARSSPSCRDAQWYSLVQLGFDAVRGGRL